MACQMGRKLSQIAGGQENSAAIADEEVEPMAIEKALFGLLIAKSATQRGLLPYDNRKE